MQVMRHHHGPQYTKVLLGVAHRSLINTKIVCHTSPTATNLLASRKQRLQHFHPTAGSRKVGRASYLRKQDISTRGKFDYSPREAPLASPRSQGTQGPKRSVYEDMQVTRGIFEDRRPGIVGMLRKSMFVSFDLEFSGLSKPKELGKQAGGSRRKMTLQEAYENAKEAVETYQLLQVGLCPVEWRQEDETYVMSPVNIYVNPIVSPPGLGIDRVYSLQATTLTFLLDHGFDFNKQLRHGVPYLSREEEQKIIDSWVGEDRKREMMTIEPASQQFVDDCIKALEEWENDPDAPWDFINITTDRGIMSRYQRMIVHQLVQTRFPNLTTQGRESFVCVTRASEETLRRRKAESKEALGQQLDTAIGIRHIIDELFDPKRSDGKKIVLVGHNCFLDMLYLYKTFIGRLPAKVEEFAELVSKDFPILIDTKYLATCGDDSTEANSLSTISMLESLLRTQTNPKIALEPNYSDYGGEDHTYHEAGYDAYMTGFLMIRLAARLAYEGGLRSALSQDQTQPSSLSTSKHQADRDLASESKDYAPMDVDDGTIAMKDHGVGLAEECVIEQQQIQQQIPTKPIAFLSLGTKEHDLFQDDVKKVPGFYDDHGRKFWKSYINKLRMFNTDVGVMRLPGKARA